jgi:hypothetical protein
VVSVLYVKDPKRLMTTARLAICGTSVGELFTPSP